MKIMTFSQEKLENLTQEMIKVEKDLRDLQAATIQDLWTADLEAFEQEYRKEYKLPPKDE
jgi:hypothetical protein